MYLVSTITIKSTPVESVVLHSKDVKVSNKEAFKKIELLMSHGFNYDATTGLWSSKTRLVIHNVYQLIKL